MIPRILLLSSLLGAALLGEWKGGAWEKKVRFAWYEVLHDSFPNYAPDYPDADGIPRTFYPEQNGITAGWQYNGTIVANYALEYYRQLRQKSDPEAGRHFWACIRWLDSAITLTGEGAGLYVFNWQQPWYPAVGAPFTSGMTSGLAIEVFMHAFTLSNDSNWIHRARVLVQGYNLEVQHGGFTYKLPEGWWYEEIADTGRHTPRILDGHIFALGGLYHFYQQTRDTLALAYFNKGLNALEHALPLYNRGNGYVSYDAWGKKADEHYHPLLVKQMEQMYAYSGRPVYKAYGALWAAPLKKPFVYKMIRDVNKSAMLLYVVLVVLIYTILRLLHRIFG